MLFQSLVKAAFVASALAQPIQHQHHQHEKKDVVTHTVVVTIGAGDDTATLAVASVPTSSVSVSLATGSYVAQVVPTSAASGTYSGTATASTASSAASSAASGSFSGAAKGITYSPYASDGSCKSASVVKEEVAALSGYEIIRLYGVDCDQVPNVLAALASGQKIFAGIYDMTAITSGVETLATAVKAAGGWDLVYTVSIGNELVNNGEATTSQIESYVEEGRTALTAAGYTGDVVSVDTFIATINNPDLCNYSDYMAINAHAYFDGGIAAADAGDWVLLQIENVYTVCGGEKSVLVVETGWPTKGDTYGSAVPGTANQEAALSSISDKCGSAAFFFNAYNDLWKADGTYGVEKYWGIYGDGY